MRYSFIILFRSRSRSVFAAPVVAHGLSYMGKINVDFVSSLGQLHSLLGD